MNKVFRAGNANVECMCSAHWLVRRIEVDLVCPLKKGDVVFDRQVGGLSALGLTVTCVRVHS